MAPHRRMVDNGAIMSDPTLESPVVTPSLPVVAGYRLQALCGSGGMARVYRAIEDGLERPVAIKVLTAVGPDAAGLRERFEREARLVAALSHPGIIAIFRITRTREGEPCIVMPWLNGTLAERPHPLPDREVHQLFGTLLDALGHAHAARIVHRDLKPDNVLFDAFGRPILADFGVALRVGGDARITGPGLTVGSARYMSPEQALGQELDIRSDLYSAGVMAYELLTGRPPFQASDAIAAALAHVEAPVPRLPQVLAHWQPWIDRALAKDPDDRFADAAEMRAAMPTPGAAGPDQLPGADRARGLVDTLPTPTRLLAPVVTGLKRRVLWLAALGVLIVLAGRWWRGHLEDRDLPPMSGPPGTGTGVVIQAADAPEPAPGPAAAAAPANGAADPPADAPADGSEAISAAPLPGPGAAFERFRDGDELPWLVPLPATLEASKLKSVPPLAVGQGEVTVAQYRSFAEATGRAASACGGAAGTTNWQSPGFEQQDDHPVVCVSQADARAYAVWLSGRTGQRYRLPTLGEWQHLSAPIAGTAADCAQAHYSGEDCPRAGTVAIERFVASTPGVFGLVGNVREWTADCQWQVRKKNVLAHGVGNVGRWITGKPRQPREERTCVGRLVAGSGFSDRNAWPQATALAEAQARPDLGFRVVRELR